MNVIKRSGEQVVYDEQKIIKAIDNANNSVQEIDRIPLYKFSDIIKNIENAINEIQHAISVEEIQDIVENSLMTAGCYEVAKSYIRYRYEHELLRKKNTTDEIVSSIVEYSNEQIKQENSNKNPEIIPTQRDYIAGEIARDFAKRNLFPERLWQAHEDGLIHIHDTDYSPLLRMHNCDVYNLDDMLQNGTVISGTKIDKPHMFSTACNIALQIAAQVASSQYGLPK